MKNEMFLRIGFWTGIATLVLLPWQTRVIFWRPWVGTTESEFGVISVYATMLLCALGAACYVLYDGSQIIKTVREARGMAVGACGVLFVAVYAWIVWYPTTTHAWVLQVSFAILLGYLAYRITKEHPRAALCALLCGLIFPAALGIWQMVGGYSPESTWLGLAKRSAEQLGDAVVMLGDVRVLRAYGTFPHPNIFGSVLGLVYAGMLACASKGNIRKWGWVVLAGGAVITAFGISRSGALAIVCATLGFFIIYYAKKRWMLFAVACIPPMIWAMQFFAPQLLAIRGNSESEMRSITERVQQMHDWQDVMMHGGLLGVGIYEYPRALADRSPIYRAAWEYQPVHNAFFLMLAELGVWWTVFFVLAAVRGLWIMRSDVVHMVPFGMTLWSLAWFDHALWTSWAAMAYTATMMGIMLSMSGDLALSTGECLTQKKFSVKSSS